MAFSNYLSTGRMSPIKYMKNKNFLQYIRKTNNIDLLMEIRDSERDYRDEKSSFCSARINQIASERFKDTLSLCIDYRLLPNKLLINPFVPSSEAEFYPEILKLFTYIPRAVVEYMCYYMQLCIYPILYNSEVEKYKIYVDKDVASFGKYYLFPYASNKEEIYNPLFVNKKVQDFCQENDHTFLDYQLLGFYNMRQGKETEFKLMMLLLIDTQLESNMCSLEDMKVDWFDIFSQRILKILRKE